MSAIEALRAAVPGDHNTWDADGMMRVDRRWAELLLREIDELLGDLAVARQEAESWMKGCREARAELAFRTGRPPTIIGEVDFTPLEEWNTDDVIAVTPEQLVRIVKEAGKS